MRPVKLPPLSLGVSNTRTSVSGGRADAAEATANAVTVNAAAKCLSPAREAAAGAAPFSATISRMRTDTLIGLYLTAIVLANFAVTYFGVVASIATAFFFIGLDITARDALHERWYGRGLVWKMAALIAAGSIISAALNVKTSRVALASFASFAGANLVDALVYQRLHARPRLQKINGSNVVTLLVDSILFPTLAFGAVMPVVIVLEFVAKGERRVRMVAGAAERAFESPAGKVAALSRCGRPRRSAPLEAAAAARALGPSGLDQKATAPASRMPGPIHLLRSSRARRLASRHLRVDDPRRLGAIDAGQAVVHEDHVGMQPPRLADRRLSVGCLSDDFDVRLFAEQDREGLSHDDVVIDEQDANPGRGPLATDAGSQSRIVPGSEGGGSAATPTARGLHGTRAR